MLTILWFNDRETPGWQAYVTVFFCVKRMCNSVSPSHISGAAAGRIHILVPKYGLHSHA